MEDFRSRVPWSMDASLKEKAREVGVDFDRFLQLLAERRSEGEIAAELGVPEALIGHLRDHFDRYGVHSVIGQD